MSDHINKDRAIVAYEPLARTILCVLAANLKDGKPSDDPDYKAYIDVVAGQNYGSETSAVWHGGTRMDLDLTKAVFGKRIARWTPDHPLAAK